MKVEITGRHLEITEIAKAHAEDRAARLDRYAIGGHGIKIILGPEGNAYRAEVIISDHVGVGTGKDLCAAIDVATDKIERQLAKLKEKRTEHKTRTGEIE